METSAQTDVPTMRVINNKSFGFSGKGGEYFSIWIVNICLTIVTLGIYSAWAKVRNNQYFYGNTQLDGASFQYLATPIQILKGRIVAFAIFGLLGALNSFMPLLGAVFWGVIILLLPAIITMSMSFRMRYTAYRNVNFGFHQSFGGAYYALGLPVLVIAGYMVSIGAMGALVSAQAPGDPVEPGTAVMVAGGITAVFALLLFTLYPLFDFVLTRFLAANTKYGVSNFQYTATAKDFYKLYGKVLGMSLLVALLIGVVMAIALPAGMSGMMAAGAANQAPIASPKPGLMMVIMAPLMLFYLWLFAYIKVKRSNLIFSHIKVGEHQLQSELEIVRMAWLYISNTLLIMFSFGLATPWALIRAAHYHLSCTSLDVMGELIDFTADQQQQQSSIGQEIGDVFDLDIAL